MKVKSEIVSDQVVGRDCKKDWLQPAALGIRVLKRSEVEDMTKRSRSTIYAMMSKKSPYYDAAWPKPIRLGSRSVGWLEHEVIAWIEFRRAESFPREGVRHA